MDARPVLVNKQFNSPIMLYSQENVADVLNKQSQVLTNGTVGIDFHKMAAPGNLKNSAVLRMLEEAEKGSKENTFFEKAKPRRRIQRFEWPPRGPDDNNRTNDDFDDSDYNNNSNDIRRKVATLSRPRPRYTTTIPITTSAGLKRVAWPPPPENTNSNQSQESVYPKEPVFNQPISPPNTQQDQHSWSSANPASPPPAREPVFQRTIQTAAPVFEPPPSVVTLRQSAPFYQQPPPIFESQPAAIRGTNSRMRGDEKWPPAENKAQVGDEKSAAENEARKALAKGPAFRPRKQKKDYSNFFAQHALANNYPGYRAPPGTQHYIEEGTSNF